MFGLKRKTPPVIDAAERLHAWAVAHSRAEELYRQCGAPDTVEGRFEMLTLHVLLLIDRLKGDDPALRDLRQHLFDAFISQLDGAMREMGVGDLVMGKRMRKLGEAFYGRAKAYDSAFGALPDRAALEALVARTVFSDTPSRPPADMADYVVAARVRLAGIPTEALMEGLVDVAEKAAP